MLSSLYGRARVLRKNLALVRSLTGPRDKPSYMHRCLIGAVVIVEFEFVVEMNLVQIGTKEFFPQLIRLAANERHLQSRPYSNQKLGRRDQSAASSELFPSFTRRFSPTGTRDGGLREPCEPQPCSLGERNVCRDLAAVGISRHVQESPVRGSNEGGLGCNE